LIRAINSVDKCCNSIATGPEQPIDKVPWANRRGAVTSARAGPTIPVQASINWAAPGAPRAKAVRATPGTKAAIERGPWTGRQTFVISRCVSSSAIFPAHALLAWYDRHRRHLPWRAEPGRTVDPYRVWLSEIMLQQTTVAAVIPYYENFVSRFPTIEALAAAELDEVLSRWAGLGYYARARNLHACARAVVQRGGFPRDITGLLELPGIGTYTAAAVAAIAFSVPAIPVDGNVERVTARLFALTEPLPGAKPAIRTAAETLGRDPEAMARPSDFAQALFDLGASICTPTSPACALCPWMEPCAARRLGIAAKLPRRPAKKERPLRHGVHFWLTDSAGNVLLRKRPVPGLLGGMIELPGTPWRDTKWDEPEALSYAPMSADWRAAGQVRHGFTHFELTIDVFAARAEIIGGDGFIHPLTRLTEVALPSVMRKCVKMAGSGGATL
jgi:A/G-specific adenine glycosylase